MSPKRVLKIKPKQPKTICPELNLEIAYSLRGLGSIDHISLVSHLIYKLFKALNSLLPKLQNHIWIVLRNL